MIYIDKTTTIPFYEQLYNAFIEHIRTGELSPGTSLPATRKLAEDLSISRNTVNRAYQQLTAEGYVQPKAGSGYVINDIFSDGMEPSKPLSSLHEDVQLLPQTNPLRYDFDYGNIDNTMFPYRQWRKSVNRVLDAAEATPSILYPHYMGEVPLQKEIAKYLYRSRSVQCDPSQIIITCGHQHSIEILANLFCNSKKRCAMEDPGYDGIRAVFLNHNYEMSYIPIEEDGISTAKVKKLSPDLLYVTPSHQFPTGAVLSIAKRMELLEWANQTGAYIIEDDYDSELRYYTNPIPAMQSLDHHDHVIYTGTFSKALSPAIRVAYIVLPYSLLPEYHKFYELYGSQVSSLHQLALADFIATGNFERNINRLRNLYRKKQNELETAANEIFGSAVHISGGGAGLHLLFDINTELPPEELIRRAEKVAIKLYSVKPYYAHATAPNCQIQFGFPTIPMGEFRPILKELKELWEL